MNYRSKRINPNLIGDFKSIKYPARRQFSCNETVERWKSQGHLYVNYTGMLREEYLGVPQWCHNIVKVFKKKYILDNDKFCFLKNTSLSLYCMPPGTIMPEHEDNYVKYREIYNIDDPNMVFRVLVFLDHWKSGHYFELDGQAYVNWSKGDYVWWRGNTPHMAANLGKENRYTMQITATI